MNVNADVVDHVDGYETDEENVYKGVDRVNEMMEGVEDDLGKRPRVFDLLIEAYQKPLYPGCTKFTKLIVVTLVL